jgi:DNA-directed RNA polymerase specialized sigma24 family protein
MSRIVYMMEGIDLDRGSNADLALDAAFGDFYRSRWAQTVRLAGILTQDASVAEELAQEAFSQVLSRWSDLDEPGAYLHRCVVNASRMYHRHATVVRGKLPLLWSGANVVQPFDVLADAVADLPFRQRAVVVLRYHCDFTEQEIAEALDCRPGTVKSLASRALRALEKTLS